MDVWKARGDSPLRWEFNGEAVDIAFEPEGAKPDLNAASPELVLSFLRATELDTRSRAAVADSFMRAREEGRAIPSAASLLAPCDRLSGLSRELERHLTVLTGSNGIAGAALDDSTRALIPGATASDLIVLRENERERLSPRDDPRLAHLRKFLSDEAGIATVSIRADVSFGLPRERRIAFGQMLREPYVFLVRSIDGSPVRKDLCRS